eukprot:CAMPEP_0204518056 /NCGR_PEP_ID=MMETSP0661-20131031/4003_1 /ASSEMBLY_ACC=CAM_ASM_000606 /TAXON_ID=109239 /ORGANISM="Alexandrium margalefi, Strain AMGDE01CS-322" /LENGTH=132 /DNA_ID=CAMNT_0051523491 /DNA_START=56 /DNA_END=452 /DNA_ORIENTATION=+
MTAKAAAEVVAMLASGPLHRPPCARALRVPRPILVADSVAPGGRDHPACFRHQAVSGGRCRNQTSPLARRARSPVLCLHRFASGRSGNVLGHLRKRELAMQTGLAWSGRVAALESGKARRRCRAAEPPRRKA